jgi:GT2 family glycosyltransferase
MNSWFELAKSRVEIVFIDNGSDESLAEQPFLRQWAAEHDVQVIRNDENVGVYPTFQQAFDYLTRPGVVEPDFIFYSHNDVEMIEWGWDSKLLTLLGLLNSSGCAPGVCGMFGATGLGTPDIYKAPYHFTQLQRWDCITVPSMAGAGGREINYLFERVAVLDGFSLICCTEMIKKVGFDHDRLPVHHMYDIDICISAHYAGYENYVLDIDCKHHGGVTSTREKWAEKMGTTDLDTHRLAHRIFYEKWKDKLPVSV